MSYAERPLAGFACAWHRTTTTPGSSLVLPDGHTDVIYSTATGEVFVAGPDTVAQVTPTSPGTLYGLRFPPGVGPAAFGVPASELLNLRVPLDLLWPDAERLADALGRAEDPALVLAAAATRRLRASPPDPLVAAIAAATSVADLVASTGVGERQLRRRAVTAFGYPPKTLHRILRFHRAVRLAWQGRPFAEIAATAGYADQPHLSREVREFAGVTLGGLLRQTRP
ncbi:helix-turn-helix transcriptional regulator [Saccharothrix violaceirubra]|uniref:AraC-like DNA-binding protein n=1 Tax=Saccharothrix violaceirubra TaxID=413306 RepID=A0A7W7T7L9_9PSEU|nr:helix-turn-helix domain-containing protein [Saccharothrix violaceirubra]MBB4968049.1 AraC-like DNA-binding protein [Saccharothrix violaceirubra]